MHSNVIYEEYITKSKFEIYGANRERESGDSGPVGCLRLAAIRS